MTEPMCATCGLPMTQEFYGIWDCVPCNTFVIRTTLPRLVLETFYGPEVPRG